MKLCTPILNGLVRFYGLAVALVVALALAAPTPAQAVAEWTIMVYMNGDNNLEKAALADFIHMAAASFTSGKVNVIVQLDRADGFETTHGDWKTCKRFKITAGMTPTATNQISDIGEVNMGSYQTLADFGAWAIQNYPANRYALVISGHGTGWVKGGTDPKGFSNDDSHPGSIIFVCNGDYAKALGPIKNKLGRKIDVVGFVPACLMGMWEVFDVTADYANVCTASEEIMGTTADGLGSFYTDVLTDLNTNPYMSAIDLGKAIVNRIPYQSTYSAVDLTKIDALTSKIDKFAQELQACRASYGTSINTALNNTLKFSENTHIDLGDFTHEINKISSLPASLRTAARECSVAVKNARVTAPKNSASYARAQGIAIYNNGTGAFSGVYPWLPIAGKTCWDEYLQNKPAHAGLWVFPTSPQNGDIVFSGTFIVIRATDPDGIKKIEYYVDGVLQATSYQSPYTYEVKFPSKAVECKIEARAYDNLNNTNTATVVIKKAQGADSYYNKLNVGSTVYPPVVDPKDGHNTVCTLTSIQVVDGYRVVNLSVDGLNHQVRAGQMVRVNNGNSGLFIYPATVFYPGTTPQDPSNFTEIMIAPYQYPNLDILYPTPGQTVGQCVVGVATNYSGKNVPWQGIGNPPLSADRLKSLSFNGSVGQIEETFLWALSGASGTRTMTVAMTDQMGTTVSKSVTVNYDSTIPLYVFKGRYGDIFKNLYFSSFQNNGPNAVIRACYRADGVTCDERQFSTESLDEEIYMYAEWLARRIVNGYTPTGGVGVYVLDKNDYLNAAITSPFGFGTITYKTIFDRLAAILGKDSQGKYRVWYGTKADRSDAVPLPCLNMPVLGGPGYSNITTNSLTVNWSDASGEAGYYLQKSPDNTSWTTIRTYGADTTRHTDTGLSPNTRYYYRVIARGCSPCGDVMGLSSSSLTAKTDGIVNGYFDDPAGSGWGQYGSVTGWTPALGGGTATATGSQYGSYYGYAWASPGTTSFGYLNQVITVPIDAGVLNYAITGFGLNEVYHADMHFGGVQLEHVINSLPWTLRSYTIPPSLRGQTTKLEINAHAHKYMSSTYLSIGIDNVSITNVDVPAVSLAAPATVNTDAVTTITATATDLGGIHRVEFYVDGTAIGQDFTSPYTCDWTPRIARSYTIMAKAYDMRGASNTATRTITATGLLGYWKLDATNGTVAADNSGNDNNGTLVNGPTWVAGQVGNALSFNGTSQYIVVADNSAFNFAGKPFTIAAWIKVSGAFPGVCGYGSIFDRLHAGYPEGYRLDYSTTSHEFRFLGSTSIGASVTLSTGIWYHVVAVSDGLGNGKIYFNGALIATGNYATTNYAATPRIGDANLTGNAPWNGCLDEVRVYSKALTADEVQALHMQGSLAASWKLDETSGTLATDISGNNNTGTLTNMDPATDWVPGKYGKALDFDGSNDYFNVGNPASLKITGSQTIAMWIYSHNFSYRRNPYNKAYGGEGTITVETNGTVNYYYGTYGGNSTPYQGFTMTSACAANTWTHLAIVRDLQTMKLQWYKNGVKTNEATALYAAAKASTNNVTIGYGYTGYYFDGLIDELRVYNSALSATEITAIYNNTKIDEEYFDETTNDYSELEIAKPIEPKATQLLHCTPNPFTGQTAINFQLVKPVQTTIKVYNLMGQAVKTLVNECLRPGYHSVKWDSRDANGNKVAAGVYLYRMEAGGYNKTMKMTILR